MDELYAKFLPQFRELARQRMARARSALTAQLDPPAMTAVMRELHGIAGEAGLLGLAEIVPIARAAEERAKQLRDGPAGADVGAFTQALDDLGNALDALGAAGEHP
jgi:HPt (histidine-containing phosphotransfer) domain-containing protein